MKYKVTIIFGQEQVKKIYSNIPLSEEEIRINKKDFFFETVKEKNAFCIGIDEGVGWYDYCILEYIFVEK